MDDQQLNEIEARANAAAPGPYVPEWDRCECEYPCGHDRYICALRLPVSHTERKDEPRDYDFYYSEVPEFTPETLLFFVHAREDVPALLAEVRQLTEVNARLLTAAADAYGLSPAEVLKDVREAIAEERGESQ